MGYSNKRLSGLCFGTISVKICVFFYSWWKLLVKNIGLNMKLLYYVFMGLCDSSPYQCLNGLKNWDSFVITCLCSRHCVWLYGVMIALCKTWDNCRTKVVYVVYLSRFLFLLQHISKKSCLSIASSCRIFALVLIKYWFSIKPVLLVQFCCFYWFFVFLRLHTQR